MRLQKCRIGIVSKVVSLIERWNTNIYNKAPLKPWSTPKIAGFLKDIKKLSPDKVFNLESYMIGKFNLIINAGYIAHD